ncbi:MAG TPA: hypothetical protein PKD75_00325 [Tepidiformaceae bacterium]|nr:hypothetical protein [Tepidiformaceae bacterium]
MAAIHHPLGRAGRGLPLRNPVGRPNWTVAGAIALVGLCAMLPVIQNSAATSRGFDIQEIRQREARLNGEISLLESDVARLTSLTRIERRAQDIGMVPAANPIFVTVNEPGPAPAKLPAEYLPRRSPEQDAPAPWWKPLVSWLP